MDAGIIIAQGETLLGHAAMQHDKRLRLVALLFLFLYAYFWYFSYLLFLWGHFGSYHFLLDFS